MRLSRHVVAIASAALLLQPAGALAASTPATLTQTPPPWLTQPATTTTTPATTTTTPATTTTTPATDTGPLPQTGGDVLAELALGFCLVAGGVAARRRRSP